MDGRYGGFKEFEMSDGCVFRLAVGLIEAPSGPGKTRWMVAMPEGLRLTCSHGVKLVVLDGQFLMDAGHYKHLTRA